MRKVGIGMTKQFAKYMTYGKKVACSWTGEVFSLIEDMDGNKETVRAVNLNNLRQYQTLNAWSRNWDNDSNFRERFSASIEKGEHGTIEDCREERKSYEVELKISDITAKDKIRFITPNYETKFEVDNLCMVLVNGKAARVAYMDETHFTFVDKINVNFYGGCFHICQFAEICEKNNIEVRPIEKTFA